MGMVFMAVAFAGGIFMAGADIVEVGDKSGDQHFC
jgi:hypothetical protein